MMVSTVPLQFHLPHPARAARSEGVTRTLRGRTNTTTRSHAAAWMVAAWMAAATSAPQSRRTGEERSLAAGWAATAAPPRRWGTRPLEGGRNEREIRKERASQPI